jgi:hypothetical protein
MNDNKLLADGVMNFFFKKEEGKSLSNFWKCNIVIIDDSNMREYNSGESCFHGEKFIRISKLCRNENRKRELLEYSKLFLKEVCGEDGNIVKKMGRNFILNNDELELWRELSINTQLEICKYKFENYDEVINDLCKSKGKILIHPAMRCSEEKVKNKLWEGKAILVDSKIEVIGKNMLGNLWMQLRDFN